MKPTPREASEIKKQYESVVDHLIKEGYADDKDSADSIIKGMSQQNRNFLSPVGFKFVLGKHPKVDFISQSANIPDLSLATQIQPTYLKDLDVPGEKLTYGDFSLSFLVDENMENYSILHKWLKRLGFAATTEDYQKLITDKFIDLFPISLSSLTFDVSDTDIQYFTAEATFRYTIFEINDMLGKEL